MNDRYSIAPGEVLTHKADVIALLGTNFAMLHPELRFAKYYERNPAGPPSFYLAHDRETDAFVGLAAMFPVTLRVQGEPVPAALSADFVVDVGHRGFGPALALQRATLSALAEHDLDCAYGCPNEFSDPVIARVGYADVGTLTRFVKILKAGHVVQRRVRPRALAGAAAALSSISADPVLSALSRERRHRPSRAFSVEKPAVFDDRFSAVWDAVHREHAVTVERSAELLNWKFDRPEPADGESLYTIFALLSGPDSVAGYVVYGVEDGVRDVLDIAALPTREVVDALLSEFIRDARAEGHGAILVYHLGTEDVLTARLGEFGFRRRPERKRLRVYVSPGAKPAVDVQAKESWHFLFGDIDL